LHGWPRRFRLGAERSSLRPEQGGDARISDRHSSRGSDDRRAAQTSRLRDGTVRQEPFRRSERILTNGSWLRHLLRQPLPPECRGRTRGPGLPGPQGLSRLQGALRSSRSAQVLGDRRGRSDRTPALGTSRQAKDRRHWSPDSRANEDLRRRVRGRGDRMDPRAESARKALVLLAEHDPHARSHPYEARKHRAVRQMAVLVPRHDDRPRSPRGSGTTPPRRTRDRRRHDRDVLHRQWPAHEHVARRRHDTFPQRKGHQLGGRLSSTSSPNSSRRSRSFRLDRGRRRSRSIRRWKSFKRPTLPTGRRQRVRFRTVDTDPAQAWPCRDT